MPDERRHRGPHPQDARLFAAPVHPTLRQATRDLSWLRTRGYADPSALKLVGDRYRLDNRQRTAVARSACTDLQRQDRRRKRLPPPDARGERLLVDGYNLLTTVEAALGGAVVLRARDSAFRDLASLHGTWRQVDETVPAAEWIGRTLDPLGPAAVHWLLDRPVSNSGRLAALLRACAEDNGWPWTVELVQNPDPLLAASEDVVVTADSIVLDACRRWLNVTGQVLEHLPRANVVDLSE